MKDYENKGVMCINEFLDNQDRVLRKSVCSSAHIYFRTQTVGGKWLEFIYFKSVFLAFVH